MAWLRLEATLVIVIATAALSSAQRTAGSTFPVLPSCPPAPLSLSPCIGYAFGAGSATLDSCCHQLRTFLQAQAPCLCAASKLAPIPVGMLLGQAQGMIPNACNLPNPCDADTAGEGTTPSETETSSPAATPPVAPAGGQAQVPSTATATPSETPASAKPATETPAATTQDAEPDDDSPAIGSAPEQVAPTAETGLKKLPELLHAAGATSSRAVGTLMITLFLASVASLQSFV